jgi:hypothetical protein
VGAFVDEEDGVDVFELEPLEQVEPCLGKGLVHDSLDLE